MIVNYIDNIMFKKILLGAATNLENNKGLVDSLNVFPVPDGDTGTNMNLTVQSAVKEINALKESSIHAIAEAAEKGTLMGARGNSGVILSQLFRGFSKGLGDENKLDTIIIANAFKNASNTAYKAVMKPVEGTILTVARESSDKAIEICNTETNIVTFLEEVIKQAKETLDRTPEMLPVLKQAEVVDAGGKGLVCLLEGALAILKGEEIKKETSSNEIVETKAEVSAFSSEDEILYAYCTEFIIINSNKTHEEFLGTIMDKGDSIVCVGSNGVIKVHIHTNNPGLVLSKAVKFGELIKIKIDNMKEQFRNNQEAKKLEEAEKAMSPEKKKEYGFVAISMGDGIKEVFNNLKVDVVISGGQTMNPSTNDILDAVNKINANNIIILPNNSNIILAANQAKKLSEKNLYVVPSKSVPQGIAAMVTFSEENDVDTNVDAMTKSLANVKTGQVTYAVRDTSMNGLDIKKDDIIGIYNSDIVTHGQGVEDQTLELIKKMVDDDNFLITLFYGDDVDETSAKELKSKIEEIAPECDIEVIKGGQPLYYYLISVE